MVRSYSTNMLSGGGFVMGLLILTLASCKSSFNISVVTPAPILLNEQTTRIILVNNVTQANSPDKLLLQALQGQALNGNVAAAEQCIIGLNRSLEDSRYLQATTINPLVLRNGNEIDWMRVDSICQAQGAHAIIEIETFQSQAPVGGTIAANATGQTRSPLRGWGYFNFYVPATREYLHRLEVGDIYYMQTAGNMNPLAMLNDVMRKRELFGHLGRSVGYRAGQMFYPHWIWVGRRYYNKGSAGLRRAKRPIRFGNWNIAEQILLTEINNRSNKVAGRAKYNLALVYEGQGRLEEAVAMAERSAAEHGTRLAYDYINVLKRRLNAAPRIILLQD